MSRKKTRKPEPEAASGPIAAMVRTGLTLAAAAAILWGGMVLFAGTGGFRSMMESRIEAALGMPLEIGDSYATIGGRLAFLSVQTPGGIGEGAPGVRMGRVEVDLDWWNLLRHSIDEGMESVAVSDWQVNFAGGRDGQMEPRALVSASDWLAKWGGLALPESRDAKPDGPFSERWVGEPVRPAQNHTPADRWKNTRIALRNGTIEWRDGKGVVLVSIQDIAIHLTPLILPTRSASHIHVTAKSAVLPGDQRVNDMDVELLRAEDSYLVLNLNAVRQSPRKRLLPKFR